jgi:sulfide:quinone oxidoreductase
MTGKTILILGGGIGGVAAANRLRKSLGRQHRIVIVNRESDFSLAASFLWVMTGDRKPAQISKPLSNLRRKGIEVVLGEVQRIIPDKREVIVSGATITADYLVIALGADFTPQAVPGLAENGLTFCTLAGAQHLRDTLADFKSGRILLLTAAPAYKCPAAPYEAAMLVDDTFKKRKSRQAVEIELHSAEPGPMGVTGPEVSAAVRSIVEAKGIAYRPSHQVNKIEGRQAFFTDGESRDYDLLIYVPPVAPPVCIADSGIALESGWVKVDRHTMQTNFENVFAIGDVTLVPLSMGKPLPKAGVFAHSQAEVVARNIAGDINGTAAAERFTGDGACFIEIGGGKAGFGTGDFYAEPLPKIKIKKPGLLWHAGKVLFEKQVMWQWL